MSQDKLRKFMVSMMSAVVNMVTLMFGNTSLISLIIYQFQPLLKIRIFVFTEVFLQLLTP